MKEVAVKDINGNVILYCSIDDNGDLEAAFETYGEKENFDVEIITTVYKSEFSNIKTIYKINLDTEILDAIEKISDEGNGVDFRNKVRDQKWKCETFTWVSDSG